MRIFYAIITRFNIKRGKKRTPPSFAWFESRWRLFKQVCVPSVLAQKEPTPLWYVMFDPCVRDDPQYETYRKRIEGEIFTPVWAESESSVIPVIEKELKKSSYTHLLTTRLDNDDAWHEDFLSQLTKWVDSSIKLNEDWSDSKFFSFDFHGGLRLDWKTKQFHSFYHPSSPFVSLLQKLDNTPDEKIKTAYAFTHGQIPKWVTRLSLPDYFLPPMWCQVCHGGNLLNKISEKHPRVPVKEVHGFDWLKQK